MRIYFKYEIPVGIWPFERFIVILPILGDNLHTPPPLDSRLITAGMTVRGMWE